MKNWSKGWIFINTFVIRELQIKTTMKYHFTHTSMAVIKKIAHNKCWQGQRCGQTATFVNC